MRYTKQGFRPSDIDVDNRLIGSGFGKSEKETIARNIILMGVKTDDSWVPFTWTEYKSACTHDVTNDELEVLDQLVEKGFLSKFAIHYEVADHFIWACKNFVK